MYQIPHITNACLAAIFTLYHTDCSRNQRFILLFSCCLLFLFFFPSLLCLTCCFLVYGAVSNLIFLSTSFAMLLFNAFYFPPHYTHYDWYSSSNCSCGCSMQLLLLINLDCLAFFLLLFVMFPIFNILHALSLDLWFVLFICFISLFV